MTDSFRREGEYPQENSPAQHAPFGEDWQRGHDRLTQEAGAGTGTAAGAGAGAAAPAAYPPPPSYPPAAPGWHEAHLPPVIRGETVPAAAGGVGGGEGGGPRQPAHAAPPHRGPSGPSPCWPPSRSPRPWSAAAPRPPSSS